MRPTQSDVHSNKPLSQILVAFMQDDSRAVSNQVFPNVPVQFKTDSYYKWKRDDFFRIDVEERSPGAPSEGGGFELETDTYTCKEYAIHKDIEDAVLANTDAELDLEGAAVEYLASQMTLKREKVWSDTYFTTGVWTGSDTGSDYTGVAGAPGAGQFKQWDQASSTPIEDISAQILNVQEKTGYRPNVLVLGARVWLKLKDNAELLDRIKYTQKGIVGTDLLASLLGLDKVLIAGLTNNTAKQGQTAAYSFIQGKSAMLVYAAPRPSVMAPSAGYTFSWTRRVNAGPDGQRIKRFYMDELASTRIEAEMAFAQKVVAPELGVFFTAAVA